MIKIKGLVMEALLLSMVSICFSSAAHAAASIGDLPVEVKGGTLACTGSQKNVFDKTHYRLMNFNENANISISRMRIYDPSGTLRYDAPAVNAFPTNFKTTLTPHQITVFQSEAAFADTFLGPIQVIVDFQLSKPGLAMHGLTSRILIDPDSNKESSRSDEGCNYLKLRK